MNTDRGIISAVDGNKEQLCKITPCAEELHLLTDLHSRNTAGDSVIVAVNWAHYIIVFILDRVCFAGNLGTEFLKSLGQSLGPENGQIRLGRRAESVKSIEHSERGLCDKSSSVLAHAADSLGYPHGVAAEQLVIFGRSQVTRQAELHNEIVQDLLRAILGEKSVFNIALKVNIKESTHASQRHCRTVLFLDCSQITKVCPLHCLTGV